MKISYNWLNEYVNLEISPEDTAIILTDIGLEVEKIEYKETVKGGLKGVIIGEILTKAKHPNADKLFVTTVDIGQKEKLNIICGAPNVEAGQKVPVATIGTWLYDGNNKFKIKKSKIRGEISEGMICGEDELGLGEDTDGIMILDNTIKVGTLASEYFNIESDVIFDIGLTPNRTDAMSHVGVARDLMAVLRHRGNKLEMCLPNVDHFVHDNTSLPITIEVKESELCPRYSGVSIQDVRITDSPDWLKNRLMSIGLSPINNVVDITNYVLHETGQPLHVFDVSKIIGNKVIVKVANDKKKFVTLDGIERSLSSEDLLICNTKSPMCIAGVIGGLDSGVQEATTDIFLESACFQSVSIRRTAKRHTLNTDASFRFERGVDPNMVLYALKRAALLIKEVAGGSISSKIFDVYPKPISNNKINLSYSKINQLIGEKIEIDTIKAILFNLEIDILSESKDSLELSVPLFRNDVLREVDVIEEILRIYGYNNISLSSSFPISITHSSKIDQAKIRDSISTLLSNLGFFEIMNNSLIKKEYHTLIKDIDIKSNIEMLNPLSKDLSVMRQSMIFGGLENILFNQNRKIFNLRLYEFGKTYHKSKNKYIENEHLTLFLSGKKKKENWDSTNEKIDFFYIKELVDHILCKLGVKIKRNKEINSFGISEGLEYIIKKKAVVYFGKLDSDIVNSFGIKSDIYVADFNWDLILDSILYNTVLYTQVAKFPSVRRDLSLLIDKNVTFVDLEKLSYRIEKDLLQEVRLFDVYKGDKLPEGKKSYAISFTLLDKSQTLTDKVVDTVMNNLIYSFKEKFSVEIRSE